MPTRRHLLSAALRLRDFYLARATQAVEQAFLKRLNDYHPALKSARAALSQTGAVSSVARALAARRQLYTLARVVQNAVTQTCNNLDKPGVSVPNLRHWLDELRQLEDEFSGLHLDFKKKTLSVTTDPIELEDVFLGPFAIRLFWDRLAGEANSQCFEIEALQPNPAATNDEVTHPHVRNGVLCAGDACVPIRRALEQGRLVDACCLVRSVLTTYNASSPHVALDQWGGVECHDCGCGAHSDDLSCCTACCYDFCQDCIRSCCTCHDSRCGECLERCSVCAEHFCPGCLLCSAHSRKRCCRSCLQACTACGAQVASDELDPQTQSCPSCTPNAEATELTSANDDDAPVLEQPPMENNHDLTALLAAVP